MEVVGDEVFVEFPNKYYTFITIFWKHASWSITNSEHKHFERCEGNRRIRADRLEWNVPNAQVTDPDNGMSLIMVDQALQRKTEAVVEEKPQTVSIKIR